MTAFASSAGPRKSSRKIARLGLRVGRARVVLGPLSYVAAIASAAAIVSVPGRASRSSTEKGPVATLASSRGAQEQFRTLRLRFLATERRERAKLAPLLRQFVLQHADDPSAELAATYLAWIAIDQKDLPGAQKLLGDIPRGPGGT